MPASVLSIGVMGVMGVEAACRWRRRAILPDMAESSLDRGPSGCSTSSQSPCPGGTMLRFGLLRRAALLMSRSLLMGEQEKGGDRD